MALLKTGELDEWVAWSDEESGLDGAVVRAAAVVPLNLDGDFDLEELKEEVRSGG